VKFNDLYKKTLLTEAPVPFPKIEQIKTKMAQQHSIPEGTFGVEYEFIPDTRFVEPTQEDILDALGLSWNAGGNRQLKKEYDSWLENLRDKARRDWVRTRDKRVSDYDDTYGPMSVEDFESEISEPKLSDYSDESEYEEALKEYNDTREEVLRDYERWNRRSYYYYGNVDEFLQQLADNNWADFVEVDTSSNSENAISDVIKELSSKISIKRDFQYDPNRWTIGMDNENIEIRSPILKREQMDQVDIVSSLVDYQETDQGCGLHIHIGVPKDFDAFDLLAMTTLVDEKQVETDLRASKIRRDLWYAKLREDIAKSIISQFSRGKTPNKPFEMTNSELLSLLNDVDRYAGTNIKAFIKYKTVEFRYFGAHNTNVLPKWINYFLMLPAIAQKRNRIVIRSPNTNQKLYVIRMPGNKVQFQLTDLPSKMMIKPTGYPAAELKKMPLLQQPKDKYKKP